MRTEKAPDESSGSLAYVVLISLVAALGGLLFGFDTAVISGVVPFIEKYFSLSGPQIGWVVSSLLLGCIAGVLCAGAPSDRFGRKAVLGGAALLFFVSAIGTASAQSIQVMVAFRIVGGFAVGTASMVSPMYIAEISPAKQRGMLVSLNQLTIVIGILLAFFSNYLLSGLGENSWRWMLCVMALPAMLFFIAIFLVPESPRWLIQRSLKEKASRVLQKINGRETGLAEVAAIENAIKNEVSATFGDVLSPSLRKALLVGMGLCIFQQLTGINVIMYYAPMIFEKAGLSTDSAILQTVSVGAVNLIFTLVAIRFIDRIGRKLLLVIGSIVMSIALFLQAWTFFVPSANSFLMLFFVLIFIAAFASTWGPVTWVLVSEIFPNKVRGKAMSLAVVFIWISNFFITLLFPILLERIGGGYTFVIYGGIEVVSILFALKFVPETKGKELEEIRI